MIALDRDAALVAASGNATAVEDFFWGDLVMSEGAPVQCTRPASMRGLQRQEQARWVRCCIAGAADADDKRMRGAFGMCVVWGREEGALHTVAVTQ